MGYSSDDQQLITSEDWIELGLANGTDNQWTRMVGMKIGVRPNMEQWGCKLW